MKFKLLNIFTQEIEEFEAKTLEEAKAKSFDKKIKDGHIR